MKRKKQLLAFLLAAALAVMPMPFSVYAEMSAGEGTPSSSAFAPPDYIDPDWQGMYPTDAPTVMTVGSVLPLYEFSAQDYLEDRNQIQVTGFAAKLVTEEGCDHVKLVGIEEGYVYITAKNDDGTPYAWYDYAGRSLTTMMVYVMDNSSFTQTCTHHGGIWVKPGDSTRIPFWNPADMKDGGAEITVYDGKPAGKIEYTYEKGSGCVSVKGLEPGEVTLAIYEKRTDKPCFIRVTVGDEAPIEHLPTEATTQMVSTSTTESVIPPTDVWTQPTTTTTVEDETENAPTTTVTTATTAVYSTTATTAATTAKMTDPTEPEATKAAPQSTETTSVKADDTPMRIGEVRAVTLPEKPAELTKLTDNFSCYYEDGADTLYITALQAGEIRLSLKGAAGESVLTLNAADKVLSEQPVQTLGDLNGDKFVNARDAAVILQEAACQGTGSHLLTGLQCAAADVSFDGTVNARDASLVLRYAAERGTSVSIPDFADYRAARTGKPVLYDMTVYSDEVALREFAPDSAAWKPVTTDKQYGGKFRTITSAQQLEEMVRDFCGRGYEHFQSGGEYIELSRLSQHFNASWFMNRDLIAVAATEGLNKCFFKVTEITADAGNNWTVELHSMTPDAGGPSISGHIILIEVNKAVEGAASLDVHLTGGAYQQGQYFLATQVYSRSSYTTPDTGKPVVIGSSGELEQYIPDMDTQNWNVQYGVQTKTGFSAKDAETEDADAFYGRNALLYLRETVGSGSYTLRVRDITCDDAGNYTVHIYKQMPDVSNCLLAQWEFLIEMNRSILDAKSIKVDYINCYQLNDTSAS
ncbi:MAG: hypothetical protein IJ906_15965 [Oscillospiraceae bacterium]|nr:hypothetical protein [Oscillospiraceae bacterium]